MKQRETHASLQTANKIKGTIRFSLGIFAALFVVLVLFLGYSTIAYGEKWYATPYNPRLQTVAANVGKMGTIFDRNGNALAYTQNGTRNYAALRSTRYAVCHVVGDLKGMSLGAETNFARYLFGLDQGIWQRITSLFSGETQSGSDVTLTIDSSLSEYIYTQLGKKHGAVAVVNYKTGEILASVSTPGFDPLTLEKADIEDTALVNRVTMGRYPPGSTMKIVTAAAALEAGLDFEFECTGEHLIDGKVVRCAGGQAHGKLTLATAFQKSCNGYFAEMAVRLGASRLTTAAEKFGFNEEFNFSDITLYKSNFSAKGDDLALAWSGVGQHEDLVTPLHMAMIAGSIANDGVMMTPRLLSRVSVGGNTTSQSGTSAFRRVTPAAVAQKVSAMMETVVESGTGTSAKVNGAVVCGKTGTAEYTEEGETKNHSWFAGYLKDDNNPYAIAVIIEGGGFGSKAAAPLAGKVLARMAG